MLSTATVSLPRTHDSTENAGTKNEGPKKQDRNMQDQYGNAIKRCRGASSSSALRLHLGLTYLLVVFHVCACLLTANCKGSPQS